MKIETITQPISNSTPQNQPPSAKDRAMALLLGNKVDQTSTGDLSEAKTPSQSSDSFERAQSEAKKAQQHSEEATSSESKADTKTSEEPLSSQYAILARQTKALRHREQQLKAREAELKAQADIARAAPQTPSFDSSKYISREELLADPFGVLTKSGMTYDQLTEAAMNGPKPQEIEVMNELRALKEELKALKGETESTKKSFQDQQTQSYQQALNHIRNEAKILVNSNPEFETIKETGSIGDVVELIEETFKQDGTLLTVEEAAQQVEDYLLEEAMKLARLKKIQQRLAPKASAEEPKSTDQSKQTQQIKTLTNAVASSRTLSARERAMLAFEGKLNK